MADKMKLAAEWKDDCQGKKDYDGQILSISTRYWPRGGGFHVFDRDNPQLGMQGNEARPEIKPSATSALVVHYRNDKGFTETLDLASKDFEGETFDEIAGEVGVWAQAQMDKAVDILLQAFDPIRNRPSRTTNNTA